MWSKSTSSQRGLILLSAWLPAIFCMAMIGVSSSDNFSSDHTSHFLRPLLQSIFGAFNDVVWARLLYGIRKIGHFFAYGFVSLIFFRAARMTFRIRRNRSAVTATLRAASVALVMTLMLCGLDEFHQSFLPERTGSPFDVLLDMCGAITCHLIVFALFGSLLELAETRSPAK